MTAWRPGDKTPAPLWVEIARASAAESAARSMGSGGLTHHLPEADRVAWLLALEALRLVGDLPEVRQSEAVSTFVSAVCLMAIRGYRGGGTDHALGLVSKATTRRAAAVSRRSGDDTRERVLAAWLADVQAGRPDRGRSPRVARALRLPETTVKSAVSALRKAGRLQGQGAR